MGEKISPQIFFFRTSYVRKDSCILLGVWYNNNVERETTRQKGFNSFTFPFKKGRSELLPEGKERTCIPVNRRGHSVKVGYARNQMSASKIIVSIIYPHFVSALRELAPTSHEF